LHVKAMDWRGFRMVEVKKKEEAAMFTFVDLLK
jgi:hypothetical protein